ncbi:hypothetical protein IVB18_28625 [Bradyrhizobium sp. 186]|uniref:hypothetical protein n=1 Tax=Bradyrhizobium sp. 186 TaxID=2782654 RepID=UPI00200115F7|nr:hypothetical protein [Bradyrhizobium sp. 186]UPK32250.1 hypothetical protein IVB18_28625 [Bradyrhizobium sp. 186]
MIASAMIEAMAEANNANDHSLLWGYSLALQLLCLRASESMGNHDSNVVDAGRVG